MACRLFGAMSPGQENSWHWLCRINNALSPTRKDFKYLLHLNDEKIPIHFFRFLNWTQHGNGWYVDFVPFVSEEKLPVIGQDEEEDDIKKGDLIEDHE